jgi:mono/diheme cytochrome c family protein
MKKISLAILSLALVAITVTSCSEYSTKPGKIYMPDMTYSRAYEFYSNNPNMANGITAQNTVEGTVPRGAMLPDHIAEFDTVAAKTNRFSGALSMAEIEEGGRIYNIHCGVCHGTNMDGNGPLYNGGNGKYPAAPANFKDAKYLNMPVGTMYHAIMYGKNLMGSYSSQVDAKQRWQILAYIKKMQSENGGAALTSSFNIDGAQPTLTKEATKKEGEVTDEMKKVVEKSAGQAVEQAGKAVAIAGTAISKVGDGLDKMSKGLNKMSKDLSVTAGAVKKEDKKK